MIFSSFFLESGFLSFPGLADFWIFGGFWVFLDFGNLMSFGIFMVELVGIWGWYKTEICLILGILCGWLIFGLNFGF